MIDAKSTDMTWYEATASRGAARSPLKGLVEADTCVTGGGLAGLTTALELARRGGSVALLEAKRVAWGASGRNGGFVSNGFAEGMENVAARVGVEAAKALYQLSRFGTEFVRREIAEGDPSIKMGEGWQGCIRYSNAAEKQAGVEKMTRTYGQELQFLDVAATRARVNSQRYFQSFWGSGRSGGSAARCASRYKPGDNGRRSETYRGDSQSAGRSGRSQESVFVCPPASEGA